MYGRLQIKLSHDEPVQFPRKGLKKVLNDKWRIWDF